MVLALAAGDERRQVTLVDTSRVYFNAFVEREVFVELPAEACLGKSVVGHLCKCMNDTRDAAHGGNASAERLKALGFKRGRRALVCFTTPRRASPWCVTGATSEQRRFRKTLGGSRESFCAPSKQRWRGGWPIQETRCGS